VKRLGFAYKAERIGKTRNNNHKDDQKNLATVDHLKNAVTVNQIVYSIKAANKIEGFKPQE